MGKRGGYSPVCSSRKGNMERELLKKKTEPMEPKLGNEPSDGELTDEDLEMVSGGLPPPPPDQSPSPPA
jgi:hypothetical protein